MSDCGCIYVSDYDPPEFYSGIMFRARKEHVCNECFRIIKPREKYERVAGKWGGNIDVYKTCIDCLSVRDVFFCSGWLHEGVWEYVHNHIMCLDGDVSSSCLIHLTPRAREKVCEIIERCWEVWEEDE
jgi:hypothetical protein